MSRPTASSDPSHAGDDRIRQGSGSMRPPLPARLAGPPGGVRVRRDVLKGPDQRPDDQGFVVRPLRERLRDDDVARVQVIGLDRTGRPATRPRPRDRARGRSGPSCPAGIASVVLPDPGSFPFLRGGSRRFSRTSSSVSPHVVDPLRAPASSRNTLRALSRRTCLRDDVRDVRAPTPWPRHLVHQREDLLGDGDVRPHERHRVHLQCECIDTHASTHVAPPDRRLDCINSMQAE